MTKIEKSKFESLPEKYRSLALELSSRASSLEPKLIPSGADGGRVACAGLSACQFRQQPETSKKETLISFTKALEDLPMWAIEDAVALYRSGLVENHTGQFMPTCAEFAKVVRSCLSPVLGQWHGLKSRVKQLQAECEEEQRLKDIEAFRNDPEAQARVQQWFSKAALIGSSKRQSITHGKLTPEKQARLDAFKRPQELASRIGWNGDSTASQNGDR